MYPLGLSSADRKLYHEALGAGHAIRTRILKFEDDGWTRLPVDSLLEGQVDVDTDASISRSLRFQALDPKHELRLDRADPSDGAVGLGTMIRVLTGVYVPDLESWIDVPVFTGPVSELARDGDELTVNAVGKDALLQAPYGAKTRRIFSWERGEPVTTVIRRAATTFGETNRNLMIPTLTHRVRHSGSVIWDTNKQLWEVMRRMSHRLSSGNDVRWRLFYDGAGRLRLEQKPTHGAVYLFTDENHIGDGRLLGFPSFQHTDDGVRNYVIVIGHNPKGPRRPVKSHANADELFPNHPFAPSNLGTDAAPRYLPLIVNRPHIKRKAACFTVASDQLRKHLVDGFDASFEALPIPQLEEGDRIRVRAGDVDHSQALGKFTIPLTTDGTMSIGYHKRAKVRNVRPHHDSGPSARLGAVKER